MTQFFLSLWIVSFAWELSCLRRFWQHHSKGIFFLAEDVKTSSFRLVMIYYWMQDFLDSVKVIWPHDGSKTTNFLCENFCPWSSFYQRTFMFASWYLHFPMWTCSRVKCKFKDVSSSLMVTKHMFYQPLLVTTLERFFTKLVFLKINVFDLNFNLNKYTLRIVRSIYCIYK